MYMTTTYYKVLPTRQYSLDNSGAFIGPGVDIRRAVVSRQVTYPVTSSRPRPSDLFLNGTNRTVSTVTQTDTGFNFRNGDYSGFTGYKDFPVTDVYIPFNQVRYTDYSGQTLIGDPVNSISRAAMYNAIRNEIRGNATNLANMLGEYKQTAQLFFDLAQVVRTRGRSLLKRHPGIRGKRRMVDIPSSAANAHLQFNYGIRPLAQDLGNAAGEIMQRTTYPTFIEGTIKRREVVRNVGCLNASASGITTHRALSNVSVDLRLRTRWRAYLNQSMIQNTLAAHGMLNPASLVWELLPFSFVVDWWINFGDALASLDNLLMYEKLMVIDSSSKRRSEYIDTLPTSRVLTKGQGWHYSRTDTRSSPFEISMIVTPQYKPSVSFQHITNGLALLQQLRR